MLPALQADSEKDDGSCKWQQTCTLYSDMQFNKGRSRNGVLIFLVVNVAWNADVTVLRLGDTLKI